MYHTYMNRPNNIVTSGSVPNMNKCLESDLFPTHSGHIFYLNALCPRLGTS